MCFCDYNTARTAPTKAKNPETPDKVLIEAAPVCVDEDALPLPVPVAVPLLLAFDGVGRAVPVSESV